eukprot:Gregarina_sp_Poly_1__4691@NODE_2507_length_2047_cov_83_604040_g1593_i0_p2_GENE_NODE_2507_length_2047_cov_83_604040_g1593_i0NODE_2507_length_2047_cov_83_604040_g1593_i0_p2_ORF_typecomplete_len168_score10_72zfAN1/PF01428_16/5_7e15zfAN1/PF01428_16/1_9e02zfAN1/PF01428_16/1_5e07Transp_Tc5_C/PF04236_15/0_0021Transp_Tc5_C/PF04236_15/4_7e03Transp_Tc5_C/PF04236_15/2Desulfoferrod_N/PF06397_12/8_8e03Desulfoferrod_N/PF06397_12/2_7e02Desulfoferrod_N/PF06397_12/0_16zfC5HC2/PF02928_16/37zfC5HC2/PF02928_16/3_4e
MAYFSDKGAHCEVEYCRQLDFLPFTCEYCNKVYCATHFRPESHECASEKYKREDKRVVVCPICDCVLRITAADDPDEVWNVHHASGDCEQHQQYKSKTPTCPVRRCKESLTFSNKFTCKHCNNIVCLKHRLPQDHSCDDRKLQNKSKSGGAKSVSDFLKSETPSIHT